MDKPDRAAGQGPASADCAHDADGAIERIAAKCRQFEAQFRKRDITRMVREFYHAEAVMEGRDLPPQVGREAITRIFAEARATCGSIEIDLEPVTVVGSIAFGNITNRNTLLDGGVDIHRVLMIWQKVDGDWFVLRDFFFAEHDLESGTMDFEVLADLSRKAKSHA